MLYIFVILQHCHAFYQKIILQEARVTDFQYFLYVEVPLFSSYFMTFSLFHLQFYSSKNTIMFDDLRRNFVMNPQNGLTIKPFRKAHANRDSDQELVKLTQYLLAIAELDDLSSLNHGSWESFSEDNVKRRRHA